MRRRDLIRGVASSGLIAVGASAAAGQVPDSPSGDPPLMAIRQEDGSYDVVEVESLDVEPSNIPCPGHCNNPYCCSDCTCYGCCGCFDYC